MSNEYYKSVLKELVEAIEVEKNANAAVNSAEANFAHNDPSLDDYYSNYSKAVARLGQALTNARKALTNETK